MPKSLNDQRSPLTDLCDDDRTETSRSKDKASRSMAKTSGSTPEEGLRTLASTHILFPSAVFPDESESQRLRRPLLADEHRSLAQVREHYAVEVALAERLRRGGPAERPVLYRKVYNELFRRIPHHPQLTRKFTEDEERLDVERQLSFLRPHLKSQDVFLEIGAGDCAMSRQVASICERVYALDVSSEIANGQPLPSNCEFVLSSGCDIPLPALSVDVVYSNQLMEHLHPDDAEVQLRNIVCAIRPGGKYICVTPNRISGPWDVSMYFDDVARGFHLREYSLEELTDLLHRAGFSRVDVYAGGRGYFMRVPKHVVRLAESLLERLPYSVRSRLAHWMPVRGLIGLRVVAWKS